MFWAAVCHVVENHRHVQVAFGDWDCAGGLALGRKGGSALRCQT